MNPVDASSPDTPSDHGAKGEGDHPRDHATPSAPGAPIGPLPPPAEARRIWSLCGEDLKQAFDLLSTQMAVLQTRAQALMGLAGVIVTVTGFSGRLIAGTHRGAQALIVLGLLGVLSSAILMYARVLHVRWITAEPEGAPIDVLTRVIHRRDQKTTAFRQGGLIFCCGVVCYALALAWMLFNPGEGALPPR